MENSVRIRRASARAEAVQNGLAACEFKDLPAAPRVIFNTIPAAVLGPELLDTWKKDCLWVELASVPGGLPEGYTPAFDRLAANSLPGRRLPRSAAAVLLEGILRCEVRA